MFPSTPNPPTKSQKIPAPKAAPLILNQPNPINTNPTKLQGPIKNTPAPQKGNLPPPRTKAPKAPNLTRNPINHQNQNHPLPVLNHVPLPKQKQGPVVQALTKARRKNKVPPIPIPLLIVPPAVIPPVPIPHPILPGPKSRAHINRIPPAVNPIKNTNPLLIQKEEPLLIEVLTPAPLPVPYSLIAMTGNGPRSSFGSLTPLPLTSLHASGSV